MLTLGNEKRRKCKYLNRIFGEIRRIFGTFFRQSTEMEVPVNQRVTTDFRYIRQIFREKNFSGARERVRNGRDRIGGERTGQESENGLM